MTDTSAIIYAPNSDPDNYSDSDPNNYSDDSSHDEPDEDLAFCVTCEQRVPWNICHSGVGPDKVSVCNEHLQERDPRLTSLLFCTAMEHYPADFLLPQLEAHLQEINRMIELVKKSEADYLALDPQIKREAKKLGYI